MPARKAAILGTKEVFAPVTAAVLTTVAAFLPLLLMSGTWGKFIGVIPKVVTFALLASLIEAFLVLPSHMSDFGRVAAKQNKYHPTFMALTCRYERTLRKVLRRRYLSMLGVVLLAVVAIGLVFTLDVTIFQEEDLGQVEVRAQLPVGTRLEITNQVALELEDIIFALPEDEFEAVVTRVGYMIQKPRGMLASLTMQFNIDIVDIHKRVRSDLEIMDALRREMSEVPGLSSLWLSRPTQGPPSGRPVEVRVKGPSLLFPHDPLGEPLLVIHVRRIQADENDTLFLVHRNAGVRSSLDVRADAFSKPLQCRAIEQVARVRIIVIPRRRQHREPGELADEFLIVEYCFAVLSSRRSPVMTM